MTMYMFTEIDMTGYITGGSGRGITSGCLTIGVRGLVFVTYFLITIERMFVGIPRGTIVVKYAIKPNTLKSKYWMAV